MRILYLSCHAALEYDELRLLAGLGHEVFSVHGAYQVPQAPADNLRPPLPLPRYPALEAIARHCSRERLDPRLVAWADVILVMHVPEWITNNWHLYRGKRVIWRSIGQSTPRTERILRPYRRLGLEVVRHSPGELRIPGNIGADAIIRFYKDPKEFCGWTGHTDEVITLNRSMRARAAACNFAAFVTLAKGFNARVYGHGNEDTGPLHGGALGYEAMKRKLREARVYLYTGTKPAGYTLGLVEAMMTGIPVVAVGPLWGDAGWGTYEVHHIIRNGVDGFVSDDLGYLRQAIARLLQDRGLAAAIGHHGRQRAVALFGEAVVRSQWAAFLGRPHRGVRSGRRRVRGGPRRRFGRISSGRTHLRRRLLRRLRGGLRRRWFFRGRPRLYAVFRRGAARRKLVRRRPTTIRQRGR
ncbi:MAG TPA: hypothetical protein VIK98_02245 [Limnochordales bacterium]